MNKRLAYLAYRRIELRETIAGQRTAMAEIARNLREPLAMADAGFRVVHFIRAHPVLVTGSVTAFLTLRRQGLFGLVRHGWRMMLLYPSAIFLGLKYLATASNAPDARESRGDAERIQPGV